MTDQQVVALALTVVAGAWFAVAVPLPLVGSIAAVAWLARRPVLAIALTGLLSTGLAAGALAGLTAIEFGPWAGPVTLLEDPAVDGYGAIRAVARAGDLHVQLVGRGQAAGALRSRLAGERVDLDGRVEPLGRAGRWLRPRHVAGRLTVDQVEGWDPGSPVARIANAFRRRLDRGVTQGLDRRDGSLLLGLTVGDDRDQSPGLTDAFRASGLTHLLAVSGQNVAFVLVVVGPALVRLGPRSRLVFALTVLGLFAVVTRLEPSVLRATAMAGGAVLARLWGREASGPRLLAIAVTLVVLVDPLLVRSLAFQLSVAATWGIVQLSGPIGARLPGPALLREPVAVTVAAQLAVAPIQIWAFDGLPLASLPANLLAGPAAGPAMIWGMTAGYGAGFVGAGPATVILWPARIMVRWIASVAERTADLPLGSLGRDHLAAGAAVLAIGVALSRFPAGHRVARPAVTGAVVCLLAHGAVFGALPRSEPVVEILRIGEASATVVVELPAAGAPEFVLEDLRRADVGPIDVLLAPNGSRSQSRMVAAVRDRHDVGIVLAPAHHQVVSARVPPVGLVIEPDAVGLEVTNVDPELVVELVEAR